jgi:hypothetical protein
MMSAFRQHPRKFPLATVALTALIFFARQFFPAAAGASQTYGLNSIAPARAYLQMPEARTARFRKTAFADRRVQGHANLVPDDALIPYDLIVPFWSDGAAKRAGFRCRASKNKIRADGRMGFPRGTVFVKTFRTGDK